MKNSSFKNWLPFIFSAILTLGMIIGYAIANSTKGKFFAKSKHGPIQEVSDILKNHYVDSLNVDSLTDETIEDLIKKLDPHSSFIPASMQDDALRDIKGHFKGLGAEFLNVKDTLVIVQLLQGAPAEKAGMQMGDKLIIINDKKFTGEDANRDSLRILLKSNSKIKIIVIRGNETKYFEVTPEMIVLNSIDNAAMLTDKIGYIKINTFSERTYEDCMKEMESLLTKKMQHLVIDLRGNGGGILEEAVDIADMLVGGSRTLCTMRGAHVKEQKYISRRDGIFEDEKKQKIVILIDEFSASASEFLAGSLQDLDRAYIIGSRSFGKGLVMQDYALSNGSSIRLTIGRYYLPSGRCIQKPYKIGQQEMYNKELLGRHLKTTTVADSIAHLSKTFKTLQGNIVYEANGITPNFEVINDYAIGLNLFNKVNINKLAFLYHQQFGNKQNTFDDAGAYIKSFVPNAEDLNWLKNNLSADTLTKTIEASTYPNILRDVALQSTKYTFKKEGYFKALQNIDKPIAAAVNYLAAF